MPRQTRSNPDGAPAASNSNSKTARGRAVRVSKKRKVPDDRDEESGESSAEVVGKEPGGVQDTAEDLFEVIDPDDDDVEAPTVANYASFKPRFSVEAIKARIASRATHNTRPSPEAKAELTILHRDFRKNILLVAWAAGITEATADAEMGMGKKKRINSGFNNFSSFANVALALETPKSGQADGFVSHNKDLGALWRECDDDEKAIFATWLLAALAGVPEFVFDSAKSTSELEVLEPQARTLTPEEEALYRPIYNRMVNAERVAAKFGTGARLPSTPSAIATAEKAFRGFHREHLAPLAHHNNVVYYLLAAHTAPVIGWTREFTNVPKFADWVNTQYKLASIFGMFAQSKSLTQAIEASKPGVTKRIRKIRSHADEVKLELAHQLNRLFEEAYGKKTKQGFPKMKNPAAIMKAKGYKFKMDIGPNARLSKSQIKTGFLKMPKDERLLWSKDIADGSFKLVPTTGQNSAEDTEEDTEEEESEEESEEEEGEGEE